MKRVWVALVMMCTVFALCITELIIANKMTDHLSETLEKAQNCVKEQQIEQALQYSDRVAEDWEHYHKILSMFLIHDRLEQIDQSLAVLDTNLKCEQYDDFLSEASRTTAQLEHIKDTELPTIQNIL